MIKVTDCGVVLQENWNFSEDKDGIGAVGKERTDRKSVV